VLSSSLRALDTAPRWYSFGFLFLFFGSFLLPARLTWSFTSIRFYLLATQSVFFKKKETFEIFGFSRSTESAERVPSISLSSLDVLPRATHDQRKTQSPNS
jgi:hypothetical protein